MYEETNLVDLIAKSHDTISQDFKNAIGFRLISENERVMLILLSQCVDHLASLGIFIGIADSETTAPHRHNALITAYHKVH